ncbi:adhesin [Streptomyces sp. NPDC047928]|uniref:adhesin n=1 Tax=unclassified Streptomyces TaxID=2593676 RepID=UPI0037197A62
MASERTARTVLVVAGVAGAVGLLVASVALAGGDGGRGGVDPGAGGAGGARDGGGAPGRGLPSRIASSPEPRYTAWAGPGCAADTGGRYREEGRFAGGDAGWYTVRAGGHRDDGCDGRFTALPMSGSETHDGDGAVTWTWDLPASYSSCTPAVYVPDGPRDIDVAGDPSVYQLLADPDDPHSAYASFGIRQREHRGTLVRAGTYPVKGTSFTVRLTDRGRDWGDTSRVSAHHGAAQIRVTCGR